MHSYACSIYIFVLQCYNLDIPAFISKWKQQRLVLCRLIIFMCYTDGNIMHTAFQTPRLHAAVYELRTSLVHGIFNSQTINTPICQFTTAQFA